MTWANRSPEFTSFTAASYNSLVRVNLSSKIFREVSEGKHIEQFGKKSIAAVRLCTSHRGPAVRKDWQTLQISSINLTFVILSPVTFVIICDTSSLNVGLVVIEVGVLEEELRYEDMTGWETPRSVPISACFQPLFDNF